jgi:TRAP-type C4-dicarboxylate transport system substrate-binding protein
MARSHQKRIGSGRGSKAVSNVKRLWPFVLMAWERWQSLPPEQRERYLRQARTYAERGKKSLDEQRRRKRR